MGDTKIEWTDYTWNPVTGCTKVSQGCKHCYAERLWPKVEAAERMREHFEWRRVPPRPFTQIRCHPERLNAPLRMRKPRRVFVNSMSDLFHDDVDDIFIMHVFATMTIARHHTFQVLTKRPRRMLEWVGGGGRAADVFGYVRDSELGYWAGADKLPPLSWPLPNVWLGVSVEDQATADERIPLLLQTPAAVRWISAEPLLGPVDLRRYLCGCRSCVPESEGLTGSVPAHLQWVVAGGESGPKARPSHPDWFRSVRDQCAAAGVPFLFKQWGEFAPVEVTRDEYLHPAPRHEGERVAAPSGSLEALPPASDRVAVVMRRVGKKAAGRTLDGLIHDEYPA
jgi:protein gp37